MNNSQAGDRQGQDAFDTHFATLTFGDKTQLRRTTLLVVASVLGVAATGLPTLGVFLIPVLALLAGISSNWSA